MASRTCSRCRSSPAIICVKDGARCQSCFVEFMERSFKVALARAPSPFTPTALACSGGYVSSTMLQLYQKALSAKKLPPGQAPPRTLAIHVVLPDFLGGGGGEAQSVVSSLACSLNVELVTLDVPAPAQQYLSQMKSCIDRTDLTRALVTQLVTERAASLGCSRVLFGQCATRACVDVLSATVTGRGVAVAAAVAKWVPVPQRGDDADCPRLVVVRPLRDLPVRYCVRYMRLVRPEFAPAAPSPFSSGLMTGNLHGMVERFVADLASGNPGVVHNVVRTAEKLERGDEETAECCGLCGAALGWSGGNRRDEVQFGGCTVGGEVVEDQVCQKCSCRDGAREVKLCYGCKEVVKRSDAKDGCEAARRLLEWRTEELHEQLRRLRVKK